MICKWLLIDINRHIKNPQILAHESYEVGKCIYRVIKNNSSKNIKIQM